MLDTEGKDVWVYADPPYVSDTLRNQSAKLYEHSFSMEDHERLAETIRRCKHKVLLSYDNDEEGIVRSLYKDFDIIEDEWLYMGQTTSKKMMGRELMIGNYGLRAPHIIARIEEASKSVAA